MAKTIRVVSYINPADFINKDIKIKLEDGGLFDFKPYGLRVYKNETILDGYDDDGLDLGININDIDYIIGG